MKKVLLMGVTSLLVLSMLAGCGTKQAEAPKDAAQEPAKEATKETPKKTQQSESGVSYKDGTYKATYSHLDSHGWRPLVEVTISGGKITKAAMNYAKPDGKLKSDDADYAKNMKAKSGITPAEAYAKMNEDLVAKQDIAKVDVVTGATSSSEFFKELVAKALEKAKTGDTTETVLPMNDTYKAADKPDERGWKAELAVTFKDGKIEKVVYNEVNDKGEKKRESKEYNDKMKEKSGITAADAQAALENALMKSQDLEKVDVVTGATSTSKRFQELAKQIAAQRVEYKK
ncbi:MAG: FMN-binding domain protein [Clostridia bacterium]|nr:FMN-binding domain protein [Clostridia bacterium]